MSGQANNQQIMLRQLPSVDSLTVMPEAHDLQEMFSRSLAIEAYRIVLTEIRDAIRAGELDQTPSPNKIIELARDWLDTYLSPTLFPVINASGVIIHTNLGRAPLSEDALAAIEAVSSGYSNLEYDIEAGERGSRTVHAAELLKLITGAEDALVVNNNAAAVLLMLTALCSGNEVIISRGQLVEIGGGFRIPDVMAQSSAKLIEVGTTNRTHLHDYEGAIAPETAAILVAHHSNYQIIGFTSEPAMDDLAKLAHANHLPLLFDQGSGALIDVTRFGLDHEPTVFEGLQAGADLVAFSGDKLLGGPQAGVICGRSELIAALKHHPLARAVRADKLCLAALSATLTHYSRDEAMSKIPVWQMISRSLNEIDSSAQLWTAQLADAGIQTQIIDGHSRVGGGSLPGSTLPTKLVAILTDDVVGLAARLRRADNPVVGRIQDDRLLLDPRTVLPTQEQSLIQTLTEVYSRHE